MFLTGALAGQDGPDPRYLFRVALWHELAHIVFFCMQQMADATQSGRTQDMLTKEGRRISVPLGPLAVYANVLGHGRQLFLEFGIDIDKFPIAAQIALTNEMFADTVAIQLMVHNGVTLKDAIRSLIMLTYIPSGRATATDVTSDPHLQGQWRAIAAWLLGRRLADAGIEFFK
ncbi:MAG: hypothetical protein LBJ95_01850 [Oscillospiraceae bacterium]|nr:hypothetical protein [Oscillospiraceae bacterium]